MSPAAQERVDPLAAGAPRELDPPGLNDNYVPGAATTCTNAKPS